MNPAAASTSRSSIPRPTGRCPMFRRRMMWRGDPTCDRPGWPGLPKGNASKPRFAARPTATQIRQLLLRVANENAGEEDENAADDDLKNGRSQGRVHVVGADVRNYSQLYDNDGHR